MACCALPGGCGDPECYLCGVVAQLPQPISLTDARKRDRAELKEAEPREDFSAPRSAAISLGRKRRYREGPFRQQRA